MTATWVDDVRSKIANHARIMLRQRGPLSSQVLPPAFVPITCTVCRADKSIAHAPASNVRGLQQQVHEIWNCFAQAVRRRFLGQYSSNILTQAFSVADFETVLGWQLSFVAPMFRELHLIVLLPSLHQGAINHFSWEVRVRATSQHRLSVVPLNANSSFMPRSFQECSLHLFRDGWRTPSLAAAIMTTPRPWYLEKVYRRLSL